MMVNARADVQEHKRGCAGSSYLVSRNAVALVSGHKRLERHAGVQCRPPSTSSRQAGNVLPLTRAPQDELADAWAIHAVVMA